MFSLIVFTTTVQVYMHVHVCMQVKTLFDHDSILFFQMISKDIINCSIGRTLAFVVKQDINEDN